MNSRRVVVTGLGALTPLGNNVNDYWDGLIKGVSGADFITRFDNTHFKTKFACELKNFDKLDYLDRKESNRLDPFAIYAYVAAKECIEDSGLLEGKVDLNRIGVVWGSGIGGLSTFQDQIKDFYKNNEVPRFNPFFIPKMIADIAAGIISIKFSLKGPNYSTVSACSSSSNAIIDSYFLIKNGIADAMVTGGSEAAVVECGIGGFNAMNALSVRNDDPKTASRPFDKERDGFVLGEGGGGLILEDYEFAKARGAKIYAEIVGVGLSADAYHITAPHPEGTGAKNVIINCLKDANNKPEDIDMINTHGTSTPLGDIAEVSALKDVFKDHLYKINVNSTKSMTGHLLGAAGVVEAISVIKTIETGIIPPTINHFTDDDNIDNKINFTFNKAQKKEVKLALSNNFGFGGHNACIMLKKMD